MRLTAYACALLLLTASAAFAATTDGAQVQGIYNFIKQGDLDMAVSTAQTLLKNQSLGKNERFGLLQALAKAEYMRATLDGYRNADAAVQIYQTLIKRYPKQVRIPALQWKIAWLYWGAHDPDKADAAAQTIMQDYKSSPEVKKATLLRARIMIGKGRYNDARFLLLEHFGLGSAIGSHEELEGVAWMAEVDFAQGRMDQAWTSMQKVFSKAPAIVQGDSTLYATYVQLLARQQNSRKALRQVTDFVNRYISSPEAPTVRLLQAGLLAKQGRISDAKDLYGVLANSYTDTIVGKKAQVRQLMLDMRHVTKPKQLQAAVRTLDHLAAVNQLSDVEAEARLDQGRLLARLGGSDPKQDDNAIAYYAIAAASGQMDIVPVARRAGTALFTRRLRNLLDKQEWLRAVLLWKRYPQLRPDHARQLAFRIARAYSRLQDFSDAETLYQRLYAQEQGTLQAQRIMLEMSRLWLYSGDLDGANKIRRWLSAHADTLYRQEMLVTMAQILISQGKLTTAAKAVARVSPEQLSASLLQPYWRVTARLDGASARWQAAAEAWGRLVALSHDGKRWRYARSQADALMHHGNYVEAGRILDTIPEAARDAGWSFAMATCNQHTGRWAKAADQLQQLANASPANDFTLSAQMVLADHQAVALEEGQQ